MTRGEVVFQASLKSGKPFGGFQVNGIWPVDRNSQ